MSSRTPVRLRYFFPSAFLVDATVMYQKPNRPKETRTGFFIRVANGTKVLDVDEKQKYILGRWPKP